MNTYGLNIGDVAVCEVYPGQYAPFEMIRDLGDNYIKIRSLDLKSEATVNAYGFWMSRNTINQLSDIIAPQHQQPERDRRKRVER